MSWLSDEDRQLAALLGSDRRAGASTPPLALSALFERAERHGVAGVAHDRVDAAGWTMDSSLRARLGRARLARELDHAAHLAMLVRIDAAFQAAGLRAVALKGPLFAERFYDRPSARATSDIDLLVVEDDLRAATDALRQVSYELADDSREQAWSLDEHHHFHLTHPRALPLELHFHAYRGLGSILRSAPLLARSRTIRDSSWAALRALSPADELVFLSVHAAAHRFVRLGWLFDLELLLASMTSAEIDEAARRAEETGFNAPVSFAMALLVESLGVPVARVAPFGSLAFFREKVLRAVTREPSHAILRSATRFIYTVTLCHDVPSAFGYGFRSSRGHLRRGVERLRSPSAR